MTKLELVYTPGVLAVLRQEPCPGQRAGWSGIMHSTCGCDRNHLIHRIVNLTIQPDDEPLRLQLCKLKVPT